jgi:hypothetical protein
VRILILGGSGTDGGMLADPMKSWPALLGTRLAGVIGDDVEVVSKAYFVHAPGMDAYLRKILAEQQPDTVILAISPYAFSVGSVANRINRILGRRAGAASKRTFDAIDRRLHRSGPGWRPALNRRLHRVARTVIGQDGILTEAETRDRYIATFDALAREETVEVIAMGPVRQMGRLERIQPKSNRQIAAFDSALREAAARRRFGWIDRQALVPTDRDPDSLLVDLIHAGELAHQLTADALVAEFSRRHRPTASLV